MSLSIQLSLSNSLLKKFNKVRASGKIYVMSFKIHIQMYAYTAQVVKYQSLITSHVTLP